MVYYMLPPLMYTQRCYSDGLIVTFETIELFFVHLIVEQEYNRSQLLLNGPPLMPCTRHFPICAGFFPEFFDVLYRMGSGHIWELPGNYPYLKYIW